MQINIKYMIVGVEDAIKKIREKRRRIHVRMDAR